MKSFEQCPVCGGNLEEKQVGKLLEGGGDTVSVKVSAQVCFHCGERLYAEEIVKSFEDIRRKLRNRQFSQFQRLGRSFTVIEGWPNKDIQPSA